MDDDDEFSRFTSNIVNAIGSFDWTGDRMDRSLAKLEFRCQEKRAFRIIEEEQEKHVQAVMA
jgi:hypothetical protein